MPRASGGSCGLHSRPVVVVTITPNTPFVTSGRAFPNLQRSYSYKTHATIEPVTFFGVPHPLSDNADRSERGVGGDRKYRGGESGRTGTRTAEARRERPGRDVAERERHHQPVGGRVRHRQSRRHRNHGKGRTRRTLRPRGLGRRVPHRTRDGQHRRENRGCHRRYAGYDLRDDGARCGRSRRHRPRHARTDVRPPRRPRRHRTRRIVGCGVRRTRESRRGRRKSPRRTPSRSTLPARLRRTCSTESASWSPAARPARPSTPCES